MSSSKAVSLALLASALLGACSSSSGPSSAGRQVAFQLATRRAPTAPAAALVGGTEVIGNGNDTIVITSAQVVLRKIELKRATPTAVCDSLAAHDDCEELKTGPVLVDLPLGAGAARSFTVPIDTGSYGGLEFKIHAPSASHDAAFLAANPAFDGVSIKVTGTYNGVDFSYTTDLEAEQELEFSPPLQITDSTGANLTLMIDLAKWFDNGAGGLYDPTTANHGGANENAVKNAIETSLDAFEDEDHNGGDDHHGN
jgi:hypothetical protein